MSDCNNNDLELKLQDQELLDDLILKLGEAIGSSKLYGVLNEFNSLEDLEINIEVTNASAASNQKLQFKRLFTPSASVYRTCIKLKDGVWVPC
jgi:hypothetical protein